MKKILSFILCFAMIAVLCACGAAPSTSTQTTTAPAENISVSSEEGETTNDEAFSDEDAIEEDDGEVAPARDLSDYPPFLFDTIDRNGNPVNTADLLSQANISLVNFWGSFCHPCEDEMPELMEAEKILKSEGCQVILVLSDTCSTDTQEYQDALGLLQRAGIPNAAFIFITPEAKANFQSFASSYPTTIAVNSAGQILGEYGGDRDAESFIAFAESYK